MHCKGRGRMLGGRHHMEAAHRDGLREVEHMGPQEGGHRGHHMEDDRKEDDLKEGGRKGRRKVGRMTLWKRIEEMRRRERERKMEGGVGAFMGRSNGHP